MRCLRLLFIVCCTVSLLLPTTADAARKTKRNQPKQTASGINDPRYAAIVMNPITGEVYHQKDANAKRYPASLTKMMTLYLLFEALENKKISLNTRMDVSAYAASQPQTNLSLSSGDEIPVETAIKALVVRSANDVSVVVAETLGGDVDGFARMMTRKARILGMSNTVFANPHGLPNANQYTTAHDMAKLGIALKRDFPRYYHYFSVRQFSWSGTSYYTHNRVMLRYAGVDGIKTGFIGASGFNLVTSCVRGGRPVIAVVMGGASGAWRDNRMIDLLDQSYATIAKRGAAKGLVIRANLPLSRDGTATRVPASVSEQSATEPALVAAPTITEAPTPVERTLREPVVPEVLPERGILTTTIAPIPPRSPTAETPASPRLLKPVATVVSSGSLSPVVPFAKAVPADSAGAAEPASQSARNWGIQVGAFSNQPLAQSAAQQAYRLASKHLQGARLAVLPPDANSLDMFRARVQNITESQAMNACATLKANHSPCFTWKSDAR
jgi:D-alanyl-D-alanine carboxypeptidase